MAFTVTSRLAVTNSANQGNSPWTTGSFTPAADSLLVAAFVYEHQSAVGGALTISDSEGLTWTKRTEDLGSGDAWSGKHAVWTAPIGSSPVSMTIDFELSATSGAGQYTGWQVFDITGHDVATPMAQAGVADYVAKSGGDSESHTISLGGAPDSGELVLGIFMAQNDGSATFAEPSGFTVLSNLSGTAVHSMVVYRDDTTSTDIACTDLGSEIWWVFSTGLEVAAAAGGTAVDATLNAGGSVTAVVSKKAATAATLNAGGGLAATLSHLGAVSAVLNAGGGVTAAFSKTSPRDATLNIGGGIAATVTKVQPVAAELNVGGGITPVVVGLHAVDTELNVGGGVTAVAAKTVARDAELNVGGSVTAVVSQGTRYANATLNVGGGIAAAVSKQAFVSATLNVGGSLAAVAAKTEYTISMVELKLDPVSQPYMDEQHHLFMRWRWSTTDATGQYQVRLVQGTTVIHSFGYSANFTSTTTDDLYIVPSSAANITDYSDLRVRIENSATFPFTDVTTLFVYDAWLEVPGTTSAPTAQGTLNVGGGLTATLSHEGAVDATVNGGGSITAVASKRVARTAEVNAGGSISTTVAHEATVTAELNVGGSIVAVVSHQAAVTSELNGGGGITAATSHKATVAATLNAGGSITALVTNSTTGNKQTAGTLNGGGSITPVVSGSHAVDTTLNVGGSITAVVSKKASTSGTVNGGGSITATATQDKATSGELNGGGSISSTVAGQHATDAEANAGGNVTASVVGLHAVSVDLNAGGSITAVVQKIATGAYTEIALDPLSDPSTTSGHTIYYRVYDPTATLATASVKLMDGTAQIAVVTASSVVDTPSEQSRTLTGLEANEIVNYDSLSIRLEAVVGSLHFTDVWMEVPFPPPVSAILNVGGSIPTVIVGHHTTRAFPNLGEGLLGPATNGGGSIAAVVSQKVAGVVNAELNSGGSITATVTATHTTDATVNGGGSITGSVLVQFPGQAYGVLNGGGSITATTYRTQRTVDAELNIGGSIIAVTSNWLDLGTPSGPGYSQEGTVRGYSDEDGGLGFSDEDSTQGKTEHIQSPGDSTA